MGLDVGRWFKYAQAKLDAAVRSGNDELDQLEAQREAELADRPWLASDGEAPTLDEARARIAWEAEQAQRGAAPPPPATAPPATAAGDPTTPASDPDAPTPPAARPAPSSGTEAEVAAAKLVLEQREVEARQRLEAIRAELGVDPPAPGSP